MAARAIMRNVRARPCGGAGYDVRKRRVGGRRPAGIIAAMPLDSDACYRALAAHDPRFDGRFFVGVSSTRIYCRPVCTVRMPRRENCRFFASAAAAEVDGYRPCLRCRPELAPGNASVDAVARLAQGAVDLIENGVLDDGGIEHLAARVGVTSRHLRRIFDTEFGVSPIEYAQTQRLLLAKRLLTDTALPVTEIALASGFRERAPLQRAVQGALPDGARPAARGARRRRRCRPRCAFELAYRPPYDWDAMLAFLRQPRDRRRRARRRATPMRARVAIEHRGARHVGRVEVRRVPRRPALRVRVSPSLARAVPAVLSRVKHAFDLACDPAIVAAALGALAAGAPGLARARHVRRLRARGARDRRPADLGARRAHDARPHRAGVRRRRSPTRRRGLTSRLFPTAARVARARAGRCSSALGVTRARARTLIALAGAVASRRRLASSRAATSKRRSRRSPRCRASAPGPRTTSRCARCAGPTRSSPSDLVVLQGARRNPAGARAARAASRGARGARTPSFTSGETPHEHRSSITTCVPTPLGTMRARERRRRADRRVVRRAAQQPSRGPVVAWRARRRADPVLREAIRSSPSTSRARARSSTLPLRPGRHAVPARRLARDRRGALRRDDRLSRRSPRASGAPASIRAAGAATGRNPLSIIVPCHRIVGADGALTGYAGGLDRKRALLALERATRGPCGAARRATCGATARRPTRSRHRREADAARRARCAVAHQRADARRRAAAARTR